ncbi:MAG: LuxR family transcriptional regulator [Chloroflexales bacterium]|nr:LuxR family transcriptional regulator [Chloroflexales bacterium]
MALRPALVSPPPFLGTFVGRADEAAEIGQLLATARLFTLTGTGGSGKTRLAAQLVTLVQGRFAHGVRWVDLSALTDPAIVPDLVAERCGALDHGILSVQDALIATLQAQHLVLVLDNCEHLLPACATLVESLLTACPMLHILATSREPLALPGEVIWLVAPLPVPERDSTESIEALGTYAGVELFVTRARAALPSFQLTAANAGAVVRVCWQVAGLPLALELAAAQLRSLSLDDLAAQLVDAPRLLTRGSRTAPPRQQTLHAALDWSYALLTEQEQLLFSRLAVFAGSFTAPAAAAIGVAGSAPPAGVLPGLTRLVETSLVMVQDRAHETRYRLLEPLRQYAQARLEEIDTLHAVQQRYCDWYTALASEAAGALMGPEQGVWLERLAQEHDNLRAALAWSLYQGDAVGAGAIVEGLWLFWLQHGHLREGRHWMTQTLAVLPEPTPLRAHLLWVAGLLARPDAQRGRQLLTESAAIYQQIGDMPHAAQVWIALATLVQTLGDHALAIRHYQQGLPILRATGDISSLVLALAGLAVSTLAIGDADRALEIGQEGLTLAQEAEDQCVVGVALANLGLIWQARGDDRRTAALWEQSLALQRRIGDEGGIARLLTLRGGLVLRQGDYGQAVAQYVESLVICLRMDEYDGIPPILEGLAAVAAALSNHVTAVHLAGAAAALRAASGMQPTAAERNAQEQLLATLHTHLTASAFAQAWAQGQQFTLEQVAQLAAALRSSITGSEPPPPSPAPAAAAVAYDLTPREVEVLRLLARGLTYAQIGEKLAISPRTVDAHLRTIFGKLGVRERTSATRIALEQQLV